MVLLIFVSGKIVLTGAKDKQVTPPLPLLTKMNRRPSLYGHTPAWQMEHAVVAKV